MCRILELGNPSQAVSRLDDDEKRKIIESRVVVDPHLNIGSDSREINIINESGLYALMTDVCRILEIQNPTDALKRLDEDERASFNLGRSPVHGGGGEVNIINEPGLYRLIFTDRKIECGNFCKKKSRIREQDCALTTLPVCGKFTTVQFHKKTQGASKLLRCRF